MKKILTFLFTVCILFSAFTQTNLNTDTIPNDPSIKTGTLSNGLKYYIKNNGKPANKVELRLVVNAGSILEDEDQQGLAHFLEHMGFNGTKHFKKNDLVDYLQSIGLKFGAHINASTGFDRTIYKLSIPSKDKKVLDKGFQILEDWAFNILLTDEEIEKERGVVIEEYRTRLGASKRMRNKYFPKLYHNSKYTERLPIGKKEIIENFDPEVLRRFYKDWYRPDLMAVIAVGDVSVEELEAKIIKHFGKYKMVENPRERKYFSDENHKETFVAIESDDEAISTGVSLYYKNPILEKNDNSIDGLKRRLRNSMFTIMINNRLSELKNSNNPPFIYGASWYKNLSPKNRKVYKSYAKVMDNKVLLALRTLLEENERVKRFGFSETEFERAKVSFLASIDKRLLNKDKQNSSSYLSSIINNYLDNKAMSSTEWYNEFFHKELSNIKLQEVNDLINEYIREDNRVVIITGNKKTVTEKEVLDVFVTVENDETIKPYVDIEVKESLFDELPQKGSIVKEETNYGLHITTLTLSNGVKVYFKKTNYKDDQVLFQCKSKGGTSLMTTNDYFETAHAMNKVTQAGIAGLNKNELKKFMTGKIASVSSSVFSYSERLKGSATPKDLETLFQLIHLKFTQINKNEIAFATSIDKSKSNVENLLAKPSYYFWNEFNKFQNSENERYVAFPTKEDYDNANYDLAYEKYTERFKNAADFNFVFVGNFDEKELRKFSEIYLASLPSTESRENYKLSKNNTLTGNHTKIVYKGKEEKSIVKIIYRGESNYTKKDKMDLYALKEILSIKLIEKLREEESGVYSPRVSASFNKLNNRYNLSISFSCDPKNYEKLVELTKIEVEKIIKKGPEKKDLKKVQKMFVLNRKGQLKSNDFWLSVISNYIFYDKNFNKLLDYDKLVEEISVKGVKNLAERFLEKGAVVGVLLPSKE